jgi:hypothetical protein
MPGRSFICIPFRVDQARSSGDLFRIANQSNKIAIVKRGARLGIRQNFVATNDGDDRCTGLRTQICVAKRPPNQ